MAVNVSSLVLDLLAQATEAPEPIALQSSSGIPINPLTFPNDWSLSVSLETRWQTDITRASHANRYEKWSLFSRPSRSQTVRIVGAGKEECHALLQACLAHTNQFGVPVPIYSDLANLAGSQFTAEGTLLFGDFSRRRFFVGGRVAIFPSKINPKKSAVSTVFAIVKQITPTQMLVEIDPLTTRALTNRDGVAPCMDVELVTSQSATSQTDQLLEVEITWNEVDGANSLPGLWPACRKDNVELMEPLCPVVDGLPVFPFPLNWAEGIEVTPDRKIDSTNLGRSLVQEVKGQTFLRFAIRVMGYSRQQSWEILRFFDAMRGRAGVFYFHHPHAPWTLQSFPTLGTVRIDPVGDAFQIRQFFKKAAFFRADGRFITRAVSNCSDQPNFYLLTLVSNLPDTNFTSVQPIFEASFDQDSLTETWATSETIPALEFSVITEPDRGEVTPLSMGYDPKNTVFTGIPGCNLLLRAGSGCSFADKPSFTWPASNSIVNRWEDVSSGPDRVFSAPTPPKRFVAPSGILGPANLVRFPQQWQNNGQPALMEPWMDLSHQMDPAIPVGERHLWSPAGWTLIICLTPQAFQSPQVTRTLVEIKPEGVAGFYDFQIQIDRAGASIGNRAGIQWRPSAVSNFYTPLVPRIDLLPYTAYITLRVAAFGSGEVSRVWVNGVQGTASGFSTPIPLNPLPSSYSISRWFQGAYFDLPATATSLASKFGDKACANMVLSYNRALTIDEINTLHRSVSDIYRTSWQVSTLYT